MLSRPLVLSIAILSLGALAAWMPGVVAATTAIVLFVYLAYAYPVYALILTLLGALPAEFARVTIGPFAVLPIDLFAPILLFVWFFSRVVRRLPLRLDLIGGAVLLFWGVAVISLLAGAHALSMAELTTAVMHLLRLVALSGLYFVARSLVPAEQRLVFAAVLGVGVLLALSGFYLLAQIPDFGKAGLADLGWDPHVGRLTGPWLDPNFAGGAFAFFLALIGAQFLATRDFVRQVFFLAVAGVFFLALLLTISRSGLLAFGVAGLVLGLIKSRVLLGAGAGVIFLAGLFLPRVGDRFGELWVTLSSFGQASQQVMDPTAALRVASWQEGWRIFVEHPFLGVGYGAYAAHQTFVPPTSHAATASDSSLLTVAATTGVLGLFVFSCLLLLLLFTAWQQRAHPYALGFLAGLLGLLVHAFIVHSLFFPPIMLFIFVMAGLVQATCVSPKKEL